MCIVDRGIHWPHMRKLEHSFQVQFCAQTEVAPAQQYTLHQSFFDCCVQVSVGFALIVNSSVSF